MSDFGTPAFNETWRKGGFFAAADQSKLASDYRYLNSFNLQNRIDEMRKEVAKMRAALDRVAHNVQPGVSGTRIDQLQLEQNLIALGGWIASAVETLGGMSYYLSEPGLNKVDGFLKKQMVDFGNHASRTQVKAGPSGATLRSR